MPGYKKHLWAGLSVGAIVVFALNIIKPYCLITATRSLLFCLLGSLFPDIDTKSKGQLIFYRLAFASYIFLLCTSQWKSAALLGLLTLFPLVVHHRGIFHKAWFVAFICIAGGAGACYCYPAARYKIYNDSLFFLLGAWSHLFLDMGLKRMFRW